MAKKKETEFVEDEVVIAIDPAILPNIAFVGEGKPLKEINAQGVSFTLPEDQSKPFHHDKAGYIVRHYPDLYKPVVPKGE